MTRRQKVASLTDILFCMKKTIYVSVVLVGTLFLGQTMRVVASAPLLVSTGMVASTTATTSAIVSTSTPNKQSPAEIEKRVREYFGDIPVMVEIARCESKFRQFTDAGNVLRGGSAGGMIGIFQFFESIHEPAALKLGLDLNTVAGNLGYARHLYTQSGTTPWVSCLPDVIPLASTVMSNENKQLQIKLLTKVVELLKELLKLELAKK